MLNAGGVSVKKSFSDSEAKSRPHRNVDESFPTCFLMIFVLQNRSDVGDQVDMAKPPPVNLAWLGLSDCWGMAILPPPIPGFMFVLSFMSRSLRLCS